MIFTFLLSLLTGSGGIAGELRKAYEAKVNGKTEDERIAAGERAKTLELQLTAQTEREARSKEIRLATAGQPEMRLLAFMIGGGFALHTLCISLGTTFQPLIKGGVFDWLLHIPPIPEPFGTAELGIIGFFFGYAAVTHSANAIAGAIAQRKQP